MFLRTVKCDIKTCDSTYTENSEGEGFPGWGQLNGVSLDGAENPHLCPICLSKTCDFIDNGFKEIT